MTDWKSMLGINLEGLEVEPVTFALDPAITRNDVGKPVKISANATVALCAAGDIPYGILYHVDTAPDVGSIIPLCFVSVPYTGNPVLGYQQLVADGLGGLTTPSVGVKAYLVTGVIANNNALRFTAVKYGATEQDISIQLRDPAGNNQALSIDVIGRDIVISLATGVAGAITTMATDIVNAWAASHAADLVTVANEGASTGAAAVAAVALASLANGVNPGTGRPLFVLSKDVTANTIIVDCGC